MQSVSYISERELIFLRCHLLFFRFMFSDKIMMSDNVAVATFSVGARPH